MNHSSFKKRDSVHRSPVAFALGVLLAASLPSVAQTDDASPPMDAETSEILPTIPVPDSRPEEPLADAEPVGDGGAIDEIIVTATRRQKSSRDIPVSIDAFSGDALSEAGAQSAQDALKNSPGVTLATYYSPNNATVMIRGTTTSTVQGPGGSPAGAFFDDIPLGSPTLPGGNPNIDVYDLATVEVLKGPQGTLFGGSALAGALRSTPNLPELDEWKGSAFYQQMDVSSSDDDGDDYGVMLNVPIGSTLALRGMAVQRKYPGAIDNTYDGLKDTDESRLRTYRGAVRWEPLDNFSLQGLYHEGRAEVADGSYTDVPDRLSRGDESGFSPVDARYRIGQIKGTYSFDPVSITVAVAQVKKDDNIVNAADHLLGGQTALQDISTDGNYFADIKTNELRFVSARRSESDWFVFDQWDWTVGLFDYRADQSGTATIDQVTNVPPPLAAPSLQLVRVDVAAIAKERALYFDVTKYVDAFELNFGGRLFQQRFNGNSQTQAVGVTIADVEGSEKEDGFNPKVSLTWNITDEFSVRTGATKGFRFGGINFNNDADPAVPSFYKTDELWNYEVGLRSDWFDNRLRVDLTGFFIDWERTQITQQTRTGLTMFIDNVGNAESKGVELQVRGRLPAGFTTTIAGGYTDSRTASDFDGYDGTIQAGQRLPGTPYLTGSGTLAYATEIGAAMFDTSFTASYQGKNYNDLVHTREIDSYMLYGFNAGLQFPDITGAPSLTLNIANLTDERAATGSFGSNALATPDYFPLRPRTIALRVGVSF